jgi:AraC-like DNA-binding protein
MTQLAEADGIVLEDVRCCSHRSGWSEMELTASFALVFVRQGCFARRVGGREHLADPGVAYFERPGEEHQVFHPIAGGDVCTALTLPDELVASLVDESRLPKSPMFTKPEDDLAHRTLMRDAFHGLLDSYALTERAVEIASHLLRATDTRMVFAERAEREQRRARLVDDVRTILNDESSLRLAELARRVGVSPYHLSRTFHRHTGLRLSQFRNRLRVRLALERLAQGERSVTRLAHELGFADHAHLTRTVRSETGSTPSLLRERLAMPSG